MHPHILARSFLLVSLALPPLVVCFQPSCLFVLSFIEFSGFLCGASIRHIHYIHRICSSSCIAIHISSTHTPCSIASLTHQSITPKRLVLAICVALLRICGNAIFFHSTFILELHNLSIEHTVRIEITDHVGNTHFSIGKARYRLTPSILLCKGQVGTIVNLIGELLRSVITISFNTIPTVLSFVKLITMSVI
jgi:hypothetical protein